MWAAAALPNCLSEQFTWSSMIQAFMVSLNSHAAYIYNIYIYTAYIYIVFNAYSEAGPQWEHYWEQFLLQVLRGGLAKSRAEKAGKERLQKRGSFLLACAYDSPPHGYLYWMHRSPFPLSFHIYMQNLLWFAPFSPYWTVSEPRWWFVKAGEVLLGCVVGRFQCIVWFICCSLWHLFSSTCVVGCVTLGCLQGLNPSVLLIWFQPGGRPIPQQPLVYPTLDMSTRNHPCPWHSACHTTEGMSTREILSNPPVWYFSVVMF